MITIALPGASTGAYSGGELALLIQRPFIQGPCLPVQTPCFRMDSLTPWNRLTAESSGLVNPVGTSRLFQPALSLNLPTQINEETYDRLLKMAILQQDRSRSGHRPTIDHFLNHLSDQKLRERFLQKDLPFLALRDMVLGRFQFSPEELSDIVAERLAAPPSLVSEQGG